LGHLAPGPTNETFVGARAKFMAALDTRADLFSGQMPQRPMSLRRRFLLWLLQG
jgi:hypothetical protein